ncbi:MAG: septation protein IspZ [Pseudomonadota bacterium]
MNEQPREINPILKMVLELGPVVLFFIAYIRVKDDTFTIAGTEYSGFIVVTAALIPLLMVSSGILWWLTGKLSRMQIATLVLVVLLGGLTVWLNDERFVKMRPTLVYGTFGLLLAIGLARGRSWLQFVMDELMPMTQAGWMIFTRRLMWMFFALAAANEFVWRLFSTEVYVYFDTFGIPAALFGFFMAHAGFFQTYGLEQDAD